MGAKNQYSSINFFRRIYRRYIDRNFLWAIFTLLFLVAGKASRVLVDRWITSETFHGVQNANHRCTGHATMSTERGNYMYRLITECTLLSLLSRQTKNPLAIVVWKTWVTDQGWKIQGDVLHGIFSKKYCTRVTHCTFIALQKFLSDHCLKHFCEFPNNISFSLLLQKPNPHSLQQSS